MAMSPLIWNAFCLGLRQGREEERKEIAKKMLEAGMDIETIATMTDLNPSKITG